MAVFQPMFPFFSDSLRVAFLIVSHALQLHFTNAQIPIVCPFNPLYINYSSFRLPCALQ
jgi:hypothetical protein